MTDTYVERYMREAMGMTEIVQWASRDIAEDWHRVYLNRPYQRDLDAVSHWLIHEDNVHGRFSIWPSASKDAYCYAFEDPDEAFAFKVRWV